MHTYFDEIRNWQFEQIYRYWDLLFAVLSTEWPKPWDCSWSWGAPLLPWLLSIDAGEIEPTWRSIAVNPGGPLIFPLPIPIKWAVLEFSSNAFRLVRFPSAMTEPDIDVGGDDDGEPGDPTLIMNYDFTLYLINQI